MSFTSPVPNHFPLLKRWLETPAGVTSPKQKVGRLVLVTFIAWKQNPENEEGEKPHNEFKRVCLQVHDSQVGLQGSAKCAGKGKNNNNNLP